MVTDPVADTCIRVKNGYLASRLEIKMPYSRTREALLSVLKEYDFIEDFKKYQGKHPYLSVYLYEKSKGAFGDLRQVSKPGRRVYVKSKNIPRVRSGFGICILSTPQGIMSGERARKNNLGGELLVKVW